MNRNILIFGGTRYFGKRLVKLLIDNGDNVTVATRKSSTQEFENKVRSVSVDRTNQNALADTFADEKYDLIYDQVCYTAEDANATCEVFKGKVNRYIHTSTQSIYQTMGEQFEKDFDPYHYPLQISDQISKNISYGDGKREAEAVYFQKATFPVVAMRIPIVFGSDDYTGRLDFHIKQMLQDKPIVIPNETARTSVISSEDAARFLFWLGSHTLTGPINAASPESVSVKEILNQISALMGKTPVLQSSGKDEDHNPMTAQETHFLNVDLAKQQGFNFNPLENWLPTLIKERVQNLTLKT